MAKAKKVHTKKRGLTYSYYFDGARVDGKRQRIEKGGFLDDADAYAAGMKAYDAYVNHGQMVANTTISVADYMDLWYDRTRLRCRNNTLESREKNIRLHIKPVLGKYRLNALSFEAIDDWVLQKRLDGYSFETVDRMLSNLRTALDYAIRPLQMIRENPARFVKVPGEEIAPLTTVVPRRRLTEDELKIIFDKYQFGSPYHMMYAMGIYFAPRIGEALGATWQHCDFDACTLSFEEQLQRLTMKGFPLIWYICDVKTEKSHRRLQFDADIMLPLFKRWKKQQAANELFYGEEYFYNYLIPAKDPQGRDIQRIVALPKRYAAPGPRIDLICTQENGKFISIATAVNTFRRIRDLGVYGFNFHFMRHSNLTILGEKDAAPKDVMERAGHADYKTTLRYIHNQPIMQEKSVSIITDEIHSII